ncbi:uncharacterized protein F5Z01DRAFT_333160 [Emericellopsis atlantica]|uniref:C2H2-type domain-containing protein n=1 Tax=Emericellopsis atlantica TaxID=2614577 RepID=A0A9P8CMN0_9HYPO|nr:uncharacterized protein F5Z01DRAFT_333160 [Emericellopsis atlantica]KAG9250861.1 hypothetical protein F5Z01DRAFT_333160 [Emericellopsis atlantica]
MSRPVPFTTSPSWGPWQPQFDEQLVMRAACMYYNTPPSSSILAAPAGAMPYMIAAPYNPGMHYQNTNYMQQTPMPTTYHQQHHQDTNALYVKREFTQDFSDDHTRFIMAPSSSSSRGSSSLPEPEFCSNPYDATREMRPAKTILPNESVCDTEKVQFDTPIDNFLRKIDSLNVSLPGTQTATSPQSSVPSSPATSLTRSPTSIMTSPPSTPGTAVDDVFALPGTKPSKLKKHVCQFCPKAFSQKAHLKQHEYTHTGEKQWKCPYEGCDYANAQKANFNTHMNRHNGVKPHECLKCGKRFTQKGDLRNHDNTVHLKMRPFVCRMPSVEKEGHTCHKSFATRGNLKTHLNKFHSEDTQRLQDSCMDLLENKTSSQEMPWLVQWFLVTFQNSNKGVKGRGKGRRVAPRPEPLPVRA